MPIYTRSCAVCGVPVQRRSRPRGETTCGAACLSAFRSRVATEHHSRGATKRPAQAAAADSAGPADYPCAICGAPVTRRRPPRGEVTCGPKHLAELRARRAAGRSTRGRRSPLGDVVRRALRLPPAVWERLDATAAAEGVTVPQLVVDMLSRLYPERAAEEPKRRRASR
jgi:hypothetical protein